MRKISIILLIAFSSLLLTREVLALGQGYCVNYICDSDSDCQNKLYYKCDACSDSDSRIYECILDSNAWCNQYGVCAGSISPTRQILNCANYGCTCETNVFTDPTTGRAVFCAYCSGGGCDPNWCNGDIPGNCGEGTCTSRQRFIYQDCSCTTLTTACTYCGCLSTSCVCDKSCGAECETNDDCPEGYTCDTNSCECKPIATTTTTTTTTLPNICVEECRRRSFASGVCYPFWQGCPEGYTRIGYYCGDRSKVCCCFGKTTTTTSTTTTSTTLPTPYCGNFVCEAGETQENCPSDCKTTVKLEPSENLRPGQKVRVIVNFTDSRFNFTVPRNVTFDLTLDYDTPTPIEWVECFRAVVFVPTLGEHSCSCSGNECICDKPLGLGNGQIGEWIYAYETNITAYDFYFKIEASCSLPQTIREGKHTLKATPTLLGSETTLTPTITVFSVKTFNPIKAFFSLLTKFIKMMKGG